MGRFGSLTVLAGVLGTAACTVAPYGAPAVGKALLESGEAAAPDAGPSPGTFAVPPRAGVSAAPLPDAGEAHAAAPPDPRQPYAPPDGAAQGYVQACPPDYYGAAASCAPAYYPMPYYAPLVVYGSPPVIAGRWYPGWRERYW